MEWFEPLKELEYIAWEKGSTGVYRVANSILDEALWGDYRIAVKTPLGDWFHARGFKTVYAATYVANIALCALCEVDVKTNSFAIPCDVDAEYALEEIRDWLRHEANRSLAEKARLSPAWSKAVLASFMTAYETANRLARDKKALLRDYGAIKRDYEEMKEALATANIELRVAQTKWDKVCDAEKSRIEAEYQKSQKPTQHACSCGGTNENCYRCGGSGVFVA